MKKLLLFQILILSLFVSCNPSDDGENPEPEKPREIACSLQTIKFSTDVLGDFEYRYKLDASGSILGIEMHTVNLKTLMNQTIIEYDTKKQPIKITYQEFNNVASGTGDPIYLIPASNWRIHLFTYDIQGRLISSKVTRKYPQDTLIENTTFQYSTDKVVATLRTEGENENTYTLMTYDYKDENLIKRTVQRVSATYPYSMVDEIQYAQEVNKNTELKRINTLLEGTPFASKNLVKYSKSVLSTQSNPLIINPIYEFNEHGYVTKSGGAMYAYECK